MCVCVCVCAHDPAGLSLVQNFPYEPEERGSDYVRLASIAAGEIETSFDKDGCGK